MAGSASSSASKPRLEPAKLSIVACCMTSAGLAGNCAAAAATAAAAAALVDSGVPPDACDTCAGVPGAWVASVAVVVVVVSD